MKATFKLAAVVIAFILGALPAMAQTSSAAIVGHVIDQTKGVVSNAEVSLVNQQTKVVVKTHVRPDGDFIFPSVQPGTFTLIVQAPGYKELRKVNLTLDASQNLSAGTFTLQVGEVSESVTVRADITPIQTASSERSGVLDDAQIDNLLAIGRDAMALVRVLPGVVGSEGASSLGTSTTPTINGVNSEYNSATIDGVTGNTRGLNTLDTPLNLDAVKEVTVLSANYQAQYGKTAGSNINIVTKSGTQIFHGTGYYYVRNEAFNANSWFNKYTGQARPRYRYNTVGGTVGGPVFWPGHFNRAKNKLFFFVSVEDSPIKSPDGLKYYTVPTPLEIAGDFSQTYAQGNVNQVQRNIKMPGQSTASCPATGTPGAGCFTGNVLPPGQINAQEQALLKILYNNTVGLNPSFAFNNRAISSGNYNYITNYSADKPVNQEVFRIDYFPTERLHMFGRGDLETVNNNDYSSPANSLPWLLRVNYRTTNPNFVYNIIYTFTPTLVNELNLGTAGWSETQLYNKDDLAKAQLSSSGYNIPALYPGVNPLNLLPAVSFGLTNSANFGWDSRFPMADQVRSYSLTDNLTKVIGSHTLKGGIDAQTDSYLQVNHNRVGNFSYATDTKNVNDSNYAYSNLLLGNFDTMSEVTSLVNYKPRTNALEWYTQDTWKVTPKLVLDYGVRYSWAMAQKLSAGNNFNPDLYKASDAPVLYQPYNSTNAMDPTTGAHTVPAAYAGLFVPNTGNLKNGVLSVNTPGYPQGTVASNGILFAPRVGFAYDPIGLGKTVIRGGFGMFYNVRARSGQEGDLTNNAPTTNSPQQFYGNITTFQSAGALNGPFSVSHAIPLHAPEVYTENVSIGVQQAMGAGFVTDLAYVGTFGRHVTDYTPINEVPYNSEFLWANHSPAGGVLPDNFFRPYPGFNGINMQNFNLTSNYNSLQVRLTRRFYRGLEVGAAYTWSRSMDYTDSYNGTVALYQNLRSWNYGPAGWDIRNNFVANYLWSIPKASHLWNNVVTKALLDNWQISGIATYLSGAPGSIGLKTTNSANITGGGDGARVQLTCDPMQKAPHSFNQWFNTSCVSVPVAGVAATSATSGFTPGQTGNAPKVNYYLPGDMNFDTALFKNIPLHERLVMQFRLETYNTFNHPEFNGVNNTATFANANSSTNPQTDSTFGRLSTALNPRYLQLAARLNF
ncbi:MAG TPA: TonB-dependent receptor [Acidobacteriaceae bacterium]|jgi:hypothetical protein